MSDVMKGRGILLVALLLLSGCSASSRTTSLERENGDLRNEIAERDRQITALRQQSANEQQPLADHGTPGMATSDMDDVDDETANILGPLSPPDTSQTDDGQHQP